MMPFRRSNGISNNIFETMPTEQFPLDTLPVTIHSGFRCTDISAVAMMRIVELTSMVSIPMNGVMGPIGVQVAIKS